MLEQRQHFLLNYFKTLSVGPARNRTRASRTIDRHLTNQTNRTAVSLISLINPYISYAIVAWGSAYKTNLKKLQVKQNHIARTIFFATLYGKDTESALPLLNLLDILTIENTFKFQAFKFIHNWHIKKLPSIFTNSFTYAKDIHSYNTRYASKDNIHKVRTRTNIGKQTITSLASELWQELPTDLKNLNSNCFSKQVKQHLLSKQSYF